MIKTLIRDFWNYFFWTKTILSLFYEKKKKTLSWTFKTFCSRIFPENNFIIFSHQIIVQKRHLSKSCSSLYQVSAKPNLIMLSLTRVISLLIWFFFQKIYCGSLIFEVILYLFISYKHKIQVNFFFSNNWFFFWIKISITSHGS